MSLLWACGLPSQISKLIFETGQWNAAKKELVQAALPTADQAEAVREASSTLAGRRRLVFLDIGASSGFYSLLAAARGYDVVAVDPDKRHTLRILESARRNGLGTFQLNQQASDSAPGVLAAAAEWQRSRDADAAAEGEAVRAREESLDAGARPDVALPHRVGRLAVLRNAASDEVAPVALQTYDGNPGADFVVPLAAKQDAGGSAGVRGSAPLAGLPPGADVWALPMDALASAGLFRPDELAAVKISAEGFDSRALNGLRATIRQGRPPVILLVYNAAHMRDHGCDGPSLVLQLVRWGYAVHDFGLYRTDEKGIRKMLQGWGERTSEMVLVERSVRL